MRRGVDEVGWDLTAPESYVLLRGPRSDARALELALLELIVLGALRAVEHRGRTGRSYLLLADGPTAGVPPEPPLAAVWSLYRGAELVRHGTPVGVALSALARTTRRRYGAVARYVDAVVLPALVERGLYRRAEERLLGMVPRTRYLLSPAGKAARRRLVGLLTPGDDCATPWTGDDDEPPGAEAFAGGLLMTPGVLRRLAGLHNRALQGLLDRLPDAAQGGHVDQSVLDRMEAELNAALVPGAGDAGSGGDGDGEPD